MGRAARGVKGIRLKKGDELAGMAIVDKSENLIVMTEKGYGKQLKYKSFTPHSRGTGGQIYIKVSGDTGEVASVRGVGKDDELFAISSQGMIIRTKVSEIPAQGRTARGVKIIKVKEPDIVVDIGRVEADES